MRWFLEETLSFQAMRVAWGTDFSRRFDQVAGFAIPTDNSIGRVLDLGSLRPEVASFLPHFPMDIYHHLPARRREPVVIYINDPPQLLVRRSSYRAVDFLILNRKLMTVAWMSFSPAMLFATLCCWVTEIDFWTRGPFFKYSMSCGDSSFPPPLPLPYFNSITSG